MRVPVLGGHNSKVWPSEILDKPKNDVGE